MPISPRLAAIAAAQGGPFTTAQALAAGYDESEIGRLLRSGEWRRLRRGTYAEASLVPTSGIELHVFTLRAAVLRLSPPVTASHITAAALHEIALLKPDFSLLHITRENGGSSRTEAGVRHHDAVLPAGHVTVASSLLATSPARTVIDYARTSPFEAAVVAADSALHNNLMTVDDLRKALAFCADWPGARQAGRAVAFACPESESPGESIARIVFEKQGLPAPRPQIVVLDNYGFVGRVDFLWPELRAVGEFDGRIKYRKDDDDREPLYDEKRREDRLRDAGLEVFRFGWADLHGRPQWVAASARAAFARAARSNIELTARFETWYGAREFWEADGYTGAVRAEDR